MVSRTKKEEIVLYSVMRLLEMENEQKQYSRDILANALDISKNTLDLYLSKLQKNGYLVRKKKRYPRMLKDSVLLTAVGREEAKRIRKAKTSKSCWSFSASS